MACRDSDAGERRSGSIVLQDRDGAVRGYLRSELASFFSRRFDLCVGYEPKADGAAPKPRGLRRFVDVEMCLMIGAIGVPVLGYLAWQG
ncbi:hypothetical protein GGQ80_002358 [Sphingomonas jinjuensis]|uniref:Uncharacterized protein n=1 Tax=Sphingomonas jinjuensis TaxID=535907 RepID=A0A840FMC4_9SPHN|nr:hypothetical protein [Sphingomonas jinjuensis]MBB4154445.1 hypothetical protein [Sphingomonas jinjuensis]